MKIAHQKYEFVAWMKFIVFCVICCNSVTTVNGVVD